MRGWTGWGRRGRLRTEQRRLEGDIGALDERLASLMALGRSTHRAQQAAVSAALERNLEALQAGAARRRAGVQRSWSDPGWATWMPAPVAAGSAPTAISVGQLRDARNGQGLGLAVEVELVATGLPIVVRSRAGQHREGDGLLQSLVLRSAMVLSGRASYGLVDPGGGGRVFPLAGYLPALVAATGDSRRDLEAMMAEVERRRGCSEVVVVVADFPVGHDRRTVEWVRALCQAGPAAGVHLLVHHRVEKGAPVQLGPAAVIDVADPRFRMDGITPPAALDLDVAFDDAPPVTVGRRLLERIRTVDDEVVRWDDLEHPAEHGWWDEDAGTRIVAPVGRCDRGGGPLEVTFGVDRDNRPCAHGVVVAMTGAGKTALLHTLIAGYAVRYSPEELCLYLLDGKSGVGFAAYRGLPHAAVISLRTRPEVARSVLDELVDELVRRHEIFKRHHVEHFAAYREAGSPEGRLPRLLFIADEFQLLFEDDPDARAGRALLRLAEQGRSAGIHLLLGSQHFAPAAMTNRTLIVANLHLRIALQMATADVKACVDFGPEGRRLIEATCTRSGRMVTNDRAGDDAASRPATAAYLDDRRKAELLGALRNRGGGSLRQVVLDGDSQPDLVGEPLVGRLGGLDDWPDEATLERVAADEPRTGGLGCADWMAAERPVALALGQEHSVRGRAVAVLRRRRHQHLCVVGEAAGERVATVAAAVVTACLQRSPDDLSLLIADRSAPGAPWATVLGSVGCRARGAGYAVDLADDDEGTARIIRGAVEELVRRRARPVDESGEATWLVVLSEADRVSALGRRPDAYGAVDSPLGEQLGRLLDEGGEVGIHVLAAFASVSAVRAVMADRRLRGGFGHRVAMQMSDDDSFIMVSSSAAARLQRDGPRPVAAVLFDRQADRGRTFKPYSLTPAGSFVAQVEQVFDGLGRRRRERAA